MVRGFAFPHFAHDPVGVDQAVCNCNFQLCTFEEFPFLYTTFNLDCSLLNPIHSTNWRDIKVLERNFPSSHNFVGSAESGFHNSSCGAEDHGCPGRFSHYRVVVSRLEIPEIDAGLLDHHCKFAGSKNVINVLIAARSHFRPVGLKFLRRARHHGNRNYLGGIDVPFFGIESLYKSSEHLLGRFACRQVMKEFGILVLDELDPARRAGCEHRESDFFVTVDEGFLKPDKKLSAFFHDGEVGAEVGVEN